MKTTLIILLICILSNIQGQTYQTHYKFNNELTFKKDYKFLILPTLAVTISTIASHRENKGIGTTKQNINMYTIGTYIFCASIPIDYIYCKNNIWNKKKKPFNYKKYLKTK